MCVYVVYAYAISVWGVCVCCVCICYKHVVCVCVCVEGVGYMCVYVMYAYTISMWCVCICCVCVYYKHVVCVCVCGVSVRVQTHPGVKPHTRPRGSAPAPALSHPPISSLRLPACGCRRLRGQDCGFRLSPTPPWCLGRGDRPCPCTGRGGGPGWREAKLSPLRALVLGVRAG